MQITYRELPSISNNGHKVYSAKFYCLQSASRFIQDEPGQVLQQSKQIDMKAQPQKSLWSKHMQNEICRPLVPESLL